MAYHLYPRLGILQGSHCQFCSHLLQPFIQHFSQSMALCSAWLRSTASSDIARPNYAGTRLSPIGMGRFLVGCGHLCLAWRACAGFDWLLLVRVSSYSMTMTMTAGGGMMLESTSSHLILSVSQVQSWRKLVYFNTRLLVVISSHEEHRPRDR